jgi:hypothetical protein
MEARDSLWFSWSLQELDDGEWEPSRFSHEAKLMQLPASGYGFSDLPDRDRDVEFHCPLTPR